MKNNKLEIGDILYEYRQRGGMNKATVVRLTTTQAILTIGKCSINVSVNGYNGELSCRGIGSYKYYYLETDKLKASYLAEKEKITLKNLLTSLNTERLEDAEVLSIIEVLEPLYTRQKTSINQ